MLERRGLEMGGRALSLDARGEIQLQDVPVQGEYFVEVHTRLPKWGSVVAQEPVKPLDTDLTMRVTGAGMLIVRFVAGRNGSPASELHSPTVVWRGQRVRSVNKVGATAELRMFVGAGDSGVIEVDSHGFRSKTGRVVVLSDRPTVVTIEVPKR
ncbi:MAG: hypothetical protein O2894_12275 [Planctomycetota bacterium]|nr:hypothetical protein [Planctomycetota bacterium]